MHTPISRRVALKASGIAIALPLLESMNAAIGGDQVAAPKRMVLICNTLGLHPPSLFPKTAGSDYENTEYLELLKQHRDDFTLFNGLSHPDQNGKEPHDTEMTWLSSARNPGLGGFKNSISIDQFAANRIGSATRFSSISLSSKTRESQSYNRNGVMIPGDNKPSTVFANLFLNGDERQQHQNRKRLADGRSILDAVAEQSRKLKRKASDDDSRQLDEYFEAIREAEMELKESQAWLDRPKPKVDQPPPKDIADPAELIGKTQALLNLIPLILQTDSSRVVTVMIQDHGAAPNIKGVSSEHHHLSHHGQDPEKIEQLKLVETEILKCFDGFLSRMAKPSGTGQRLLDDTSVLLGSNLGNANAHDPTNLPIILAGGGFKHGRFVDNDKSDNIPLCNLFVTLLQNMGIEVEQFGTSTGVLSVT